ncbi:hypothetical protein, conserved [Angomonas deanei]|uniref:EGF-like domain-containing protein n=1 Tax=Angomonas deanei TaxID=59799 RepID=A0A7G2CJT7_9TRYP|nr:hypothetical protein, conserved [Angomonas deanei]
MYTHLLRVLSFLLLLGIVCSHAGTIDFPTADEVIADQTFDNHTINFTKVYANGATIVMDVTGSTVVGAGLRIQGTYSVPPDVGYDRVNFTMRDTTIEDTTIFIQGYFPRNSTVRISGTTATMKSATPVFSLVGHAPVFWVTLFIEDTKATWADATKNDAVMRLGGELRHWLNEGGAFYFVRTTATRAASIVKVVNPLCTRHFDSDYNIEFFSEPFEYCIDVYEGFFTIDYATCYDCTEALYLAESACSFGCVNGMVRFSNNTITGGKPFMKCADPSHCMRCLDNGNYILSGIYTEGYLFDKSDYSGDANIIEVEKCKLTISHINAKAIHPPQLNNAPNYWSVNNSQEIAVMENVTLDGKKVAPTLEAYNAVGLNPTHVNDNGVLKEKRASTDLGNIGDPSIGNCQAGKYESVKWEPDPLKPGVNWRPQCVCKAGYVEPYCTITYDPILYNSGYTYAPPACAVANCNSCQWGYSDICSVCKAGYKLSGKTCVAKGCNPAPCQQCVFDSETACAVCKAGYSLATDDTVCVTTIPNCKTHLSTGKCSECLSPYIFSEDATACVASRPDCVKYASNGKCTECNDGKSVSSDAGTCVPTVSDCKTHLSTGKCSECNDGKSVSDDGTTCVPTIPDCKTYLSTGECTECNDGKSVSVEATTCVPTIPDCQVHLSTGKCSGCVEPNILSEDATACVKPLDDCVKYASDGKCTECNDGKSVSNDASACVPTIPDCQVHLSTGKCSECTAPSVLSEDATACVSTLPDCVKYASDGKCTECNDGKSVSDDGTTCVPTIPDCETHLSTGKCSECNDGKSVSDDGTTCVDTVPNCRTHSSTGVCVECKDGNSFSSDVTTCVPTIPDCKTHHSSGNCTECHPPFVLPDDFTTCVTPVPNCTVHLHTGVCRTCLENLTTSVDNTCVEILPGCKVYSGEGRCNQCNDGYEMNGNGCAAAKGGDGGLPTAAIIGIVIAAVILLLLLLLLLLFLCCRRPKTSYESVDWQQRQSPVDSDKHKDIATTEETEVTQFNDGAATEANPLDTQDNEDVTAVARRKSRRARSVRRTEALVADIELEDMFSARNEIVEDTV